MEYWDADDNKEDENRETGILTVGKPTDNTENAYLDMTRTDKFHPTATTGTADVISMEEWKNNPVPGPYWVYDGVWAYWAQAIEPGYDDEGSPLYADENNTFNNYIHSTGHLLTGLEDLDAIDEDYVYAIHVTAQFVTKNDLGKDTNTGFYDTTKGSAPSQDAMEFLEAIGAVSPSGTDDEESTDSETVELILDNTWENSADISSGDIIKLTVKDENGEIVTSDDYSLAIKESVEVGDGDFSEIDYTGEYTYDPESGTLIFEDDRDSVTIYIYAENDDGLKVGGIVTITKSADDGSSSGDDDEGTHEPNSVEIGGMAYENTPSNAMAANFIAVPYESLYGSVDEDSLPSYPISVNFYDADGKLIDLKDENCEYVMVYADTEIFGGKEIIKTGEENGWMYYDYLVTETETEKVILDMTMGDGEFNFLTLFGDRSYITNSKFGLIKKSDIGELTEISETEDGQTHVGKFGFVDADKVVMQSETYFAYNSSHHTFDRIHTIEAATLYIPTSIETTEKNYETGKYTYKVLATEKYEMKADARFAVMRNEDDTICIFDLFTAPAYANYEQYTGETSIGFVNFKQLLIDGIALEEKQVEGFYRNHYLYDNDCPFNS